VITALARLLRPARTPPADIVPLRHGVVLVGWCADCNRDRYLLHRIYSGELVCVDAVDCRLNQEGET
jgi:hypothetical protein